MPGPHFLIIGAQKCGTTSLHAWLAQHPDLQLSEPKEVHFFDQHFHRGSEWYDAHFSGERGGESTPYYLYHPLAPARCAAAAPKARLIALLRDPVKRALSHYYHVRRAGTEALPFSEAVALERLRLRGEAEKLAEDGRYQSYNHQKFSYLARGLYAEQLARWLAHFPREQLLVLPSSRVYGDPAGTLDEVCGFLGVSPLRLREFPSLNTSGGYPPMNPALEAALRAYYAPHNARLLALLGGDERWRAEIAGWGLPQEAELSMALGA